jgi:hypothetical protein
MLKRPLVTCAGVMVLGLLLAGVYSWLKSPGEVEEATSSIDYSAYSVGFANALIPIDRESRSYSNLNREEVDGLLEKVETVEDAAKSYEVTRRAMYKGSYTDLARHLWVEECREMVLASNNSLGTIISWVDDECPDGSGLDLATDLAELAGNCSDWAAVVGFAGCDQGSREGLPACQLLVPQFKAICSVEIASTEERKKLAALRWDIPHRYRSEIEEKVKRVYNELFLEAESFEELASLQEEVSFNWKVSDQVARHIISLTSSSEEIKSLWVWLPDSGTESFNQRWAEHSRREIAEALTREEAWDALISSPESAEIQELALAKISSFY